MASSVPSESMAPSRRALLAGALGGIGAWAASVVGQARPVRAEGEIMVVGGTYDTVESTTRLRDTVNGATVFWAHNSLNGTAVRAESKDGFGLVANSGSKAAVFATSSSALGVIGFSGTSTGIQGSSGSLPNPRAKTGVYGTASVDSSSKGVWGNSAKGHGIHGQADSGWAGYFDGRLFVKKYVELAEIRTPTAPGSNEARLFIRDNGNGRTQLCVRFHTGSVRVLATQP